MKLDREFYQSGSVTEIAKQLIGKALVTDIDGAITKGLIVETEAYSWKERGCHAFEGRKTARNSVMFEDGGLAYVYLCYGIHEMFNVVTNRQGVAEAVLIRALEPLEGVELMKRRRGNKTTALHLTSGPGKLTKALGIDRRLNGKPLDKHEVWIEDLGKTIAKKDIEASSRIGIDYAGEDASLPWRFTLRGNVWVSREPGK